MIVTSGDGEKPKRPIHEVMGIPNTGSSSRGSTWWKRVLACPREHALVNILGWRERGLAPPLDMGIAWHALLECYYRDVFKKQHGVILLENPDTAAFRMLEPLSKEPGYDKEYAQLSSMLDMHFRRWHDHDHEQWEVIAVEIGLESETAGFPYSARLDLFVRDHGVMGTPCKIIEHKSASRLDNNLVSGYNQDPQIIGQVWLVQAEVDLQHYGPFVGSTVSITTKTKVPDAVRVPVTPSPKAIEAWKSSMLFWWQQLRAYEDAGYPQNFGACSRRFGRCPMWEVCYFHPGISFDEHVKRGPPQGFLDAQAKDT